MLLSRAEQREAIETAREFGREFADVWDDEPSRAAFCETAIWWCFEEKHCNSVELSLWEEAPGLAADPRIAAFAVGCYERRSELGK